MTLEGVAAALVRASLEGGVLVLAVAVISRLLPRGAAAARSALWWLASLRLVFALTAAPALPAVRVPVPPVAARVASAAAATPRPAVVDGAVHLASSAATRVASLTPPESARGRMALAALLAFWLAGVAASVALRARAMRRIVALWRAAVPVESDVMRAWFAEWLGERAAGRVQVRASDRVEAPLILGLGRPCVLLPSRCLALEPASLRMALAHEAGHVRRRDLAWGWVPAAAECLFWFHPLARWCAREYVQAREEACDAEALRLSGAASDRYGELLVEFGVDRSRSLSLAASCGSSHARQLRRRLSMLAHDVIPTRTQRVIGAVALTLVAVLAVIPATLVRANGGRSHRQERTVTRVTGPNSETWLVSESIDGNRFSYGYAHGDDWTLAGTFDTRALRWLRGIRAERPTDVAIFQLGDRKYVVRDPEAAALVKRELEPAIALGRDQGTLGEAQGKLGEAQGRLSEMQSEVDQRREQAEARLEALDEAGEQRELSAAERARADDERARLRETIEEIDRHAPEIELRQEQLGQRQEEIGRMQSEIQLREARTTHQVRERMLMLAKQMIEDGRAERVR